MYFIFIFKLCITLLNINLLSIISGILKKFKNNKNFLTIKKIYIQHLVEILSRYDNYTGFVIV